VLRSTTAGFHGGSTQFRSRNSYTTRLTLAQRKSRPWRPTRRRLYGWRTTRKRLHDLVICADPVRLKTPAEHRQAECRGVDQGSGRCGLIWAQRQRCCRRSSGKYGWRACLWIAAGLPNGSCDCRIRKFARGFRAAVREGDPLASGPPQVSASHSAAFAICRPGSRLKRMAINSS
jgi:hypothetical protein